MNNATGERIKTIRDSLHMTQEEFAEFAKIGRPNLARYETGKSEPSISVLLRIAEAANVSVDYLLGRACEQKKELPIPPPDEMAARPTENEPPVSNERMEEIIKQAYLLIMQKELNGKEQP